MTTCHYYYRRFKVKTQNLVRKVLKGVRCCHQVAIKPAEVHHSFLNIVISVFGVLWSFHFFVHFPSVPFSV